MGKKKKKDQFETSFGEMMAQLGVQKADLLKKKAPPPRKSAPPTRKKPDVQPMRDARFEELGAESGHRAEVRQLLETVHELRQQRDRLRGLLSERDQQVEGYLEQLATARLKLREQDDLRRSDMAQIGRLRRELESMTDRHAAAARQRDTLQRSIERLRAQQPAPDPAPPSPLLTPPDEDDDSDIRHAAFAVATACQDLGIQRIAVVGGSPPYHARLKALFGEALSLRLVDGSERRNLKQARSDIAWADLVIVWGGTILDHSLSQLYRGDSVLTIAHRGLAGMLRSLAEELG